VTVVSGEIGLQARAVSCQLCVVRKTKKTKQTLKRQWIVVSDQQDITEQMNKMD
jgi:hypothetical protein